MDKFKYEDLIRELEMFLDKEGRWLNGGAIDVILHAIELAESCG